MGAGLWRHLLVDPGAADYDAVPLASDSPAGPAGNDVPELGTGSDQTDHSNGYCGYPADRHVGSHRNQNPAR